MYTSLSIERRRFQCGVCGKQVEVEVKVIEKWVAVCLHEDTQGKVLPIMQLREEGKLIQQ